MSDARDKKHDPTRIEATIEGEHYVFDTVEAYHAWLNERGIRPTRVIGMSMSIGETKPATDPVRLSLRPEDIAFGEPRGASVDVVCRFCGARIDRDAANTKHFYREHLMCLWRAIETANRVELSLDLGFVANISVPERIETVVARNKTSGGEPAFIYGPLSPDAESELHAQGWTTVSRSLSGFVHMVRDVDAYNASVRRKG